MRLYKNQCIVAVQGGSYVWPSGRETVRFGFDGKVEDGLLNFGSWIVCEDFFVSFIKEDDEHATS